MRCSELREHLRTIMALHGDIEVRVDTDIFRDSMPRDVTSLDVATFYLRNVGDIAIGVWPHEGGTERVILYCGNEPKVIL